MGHIFRPGLHACDAAGRLVFLDVAADRYFALSGASDDICRRLVAGTPSASGDKQDINNLVTKGILCHVDQAAKPELCRPPPDVRIGLSELLVQPRAGLVLKALARHAFAIGELKLKPLGAILKGTTLRKMTISSSRVQMTDPSELASAYAKADRTMSALERCLPRSIALSRAMIASGIVPTLVLGVKLRPFEAHCWVQHEDMLISDEMATVKPFTPIYVL